MKILISQKTPSNLAAYETVASAHNVEFDFKPFFLIEPLSAKEFRAQRINLPDYTAVTFSSRHAIDAYFALCNEMRFKVPETMKYFCTTELVATYLQKHIVYRKRKIFFGTGSAESLVSLIGPKHKGENFLITSSDAANVEEMGKLFTAAGIKFDSARIVKNVTQDIKDLDLASYELIALINPYDVVSLFENFPDFKQGKVNFLAYGKKIVGAMQEKGLTPCITGPTPEAPSIVKTVDLYLKNK